MRLRAPRGTAAADAAENAAAVAGRSMRVPTLATLTTLATLVIRPAASGRDLALEVGEELINCIPA